MASIQTSLRDALKTLVDAAKSGYVIGSSVTESSFFPQENLESLGSAPQIKFVAIGWHSNRERILRNRTSEVDVPCQIAVQKLVTDITDTDAIDDLVELCEQVQATVETDISSPRFSWLRTEPLRDENGLIYSYQRLAMESVFQSVFTPVYRYISEP